MVAAVLHNPPDIPVEEGRRIPGNKGIWVGITCEIIEFVVLFAVYFVARAHFPDAKSCDLMRLCGNIAPIQYEAHAMGYELAHDEKAERVRQLKAELAALEAAA